MNIRDCHKSQPDDHWTDYLEKLSISSKGGRDASRVKC